MRSRDPQVSPGGRKGQRAFGFAVGFGNHPLNIDSSTSKGPTTQIIGF